MTTASARNDWDEIVEDWLASLGNAQAIAALSQLARTAARAIVGSRSDVAALDFIEEAPAILWLELPGAASKAPILHARALIHQLLRRDWLDQKGRAKKGGLAIRHRIEVRPLDSPDGRALVTPSQCIEQLQVYFRPLRNRLATLGFRPPASRGVHDHAVFVLAMRLALCESRYLVPLLEAMDARDGLAPGVGVLCVAEELLPWRAQDEALRFRPNLPDLREIWQGLRDSAPAIAPAIPAVIDIAHILSSGGRPTLPAKGVSRWIRGSVRRVRKELGAANWQVLFAPWWPRRSDRVTRRKSHDAPTATGVLQPCVVVSQATALELDVQARKLLQLVDAARAELGAVSRLARKKRSIDFMAFILLRTRLGLSALLAHPASAGLLVECARQRPALEGQNAAQVAALILPWNPEVSKRCICNGSPDLAANWEDYALLAASGPVPIGTSREEAQLLSRVLGRDITAGGVRIWSLRARAFCLEQFGFTSCTASLLTLPSHQGE